MKIANGIHHAHNSGHIYEENRAAFAQLIIHADSVINVLTRIADPNAEPLTGEQARMMASNLLMTLNRY